VRDAYEISLGIPKRENWRPGRRWKVVIKINLKEVECEGVEVIKLAQDMVKWRALVNTVMNLRLPRSFSKGLCSVGIVVS
jgi:hypothetical protein